MASCCCVLFFLFCFVFFCFFLLWVFFFCALVSGDTGLEMIDALARGAKQALHEGGWLLLEHGYDQGAAVAALLTSLGYREVTSYRDHAGHLRVTLGKN